jgi:hypothetical protein
MFKTFRHAVDGSLRRERARSARSDYVPGHLGKSPIGL